MSGDELAEPPGDGWDLYIDPWGCRQPDASPEMHLLAGKVLEIWRKEWGNETHFMSQKTAHPHMNVADLWWRPA